MFSNIFRKTGISKIESNLHDAEQNQIASSVQSLEQIAQSQIKITVIIPVYNTMPYLTELLNSLESQSLSADIFEVIAVNDGSTDFSGEILDIYAKRNTNFRVIHQENSGWPGKPRNVGIDEAVGEWLFFCDGDDVLGRESLSRMLSFAQKNNVDILIPKMVGLNGRKIMSSLYLKTLVDTPLEVSLRSLNPIKLIRKSLLVDNNIRFNEERVRLEDGMAVVEAYVHAKRVSILSDYDYYQARTRSDGQNISITYIDPSGYVASLTHIANMVESSLGDNERSQKLIAGLFARKCIPFYLGKRFLVYSDEARREWMAQHFRFLERFLPDNTLGFFNEFQAKRINAIIDGKYDDLVRLAEADVRNDLKPDLLQIQKTADGIQIKIRSYATNRTPSGIVIEDRDGGQKIIKELAQVLKSDTLNAEILSHELAGKISKFGNIGVLYNDSEFRRIAVPQAVEDAIVRDVRFYRTVNGFFSVDVRKAKA